MSEFTTARLLAALQTHLPLPAGSRLCIALSGGLDSIVLLHGLAQLKELQQWRVRAVHVDHQLQVLSSQWSQHCEHWARQLDIECCVMRVQVEQLAQLGVEAAARKARYSALQLALQQDEVLLTAHHADDQLETVLLALMRGAGVDGLAAMPACARLGLGWHLRPLLGFTRAELQTWAQTHQLQFVEDPTNTDPRFDRNFLRQQISPLLKMRWPSAARTASRSAVHLGEAKHLLDSFVAQDYAHAERDGCLDVTIVRQLSAPRRHALLRHWLQQYQVLMPSTRVLQALAHDMLHAADDRVPTSSWNGAAVHRYRGRLYLETRTVEWRAQEMSWRRSEALQLSNSMGSLHLQAPNHRAVANASSPPAWRQLAVARLPEVLTIRFRQGGERIRLPREPQHRELKKLLQNSAVLPWWRERLPLIYAASELVAIADLWISDEFAARGDELAAVVWWRERPRIMA